MGKLLDAVMRRPGRTAAVVAAIAPPTPPEAALALNADPPSTFSTLVPNMRTPAPRLGVVLVCTCVLLKVTVAS